MSCPACLSGNTHNHVAPRGEMTTLHGMECYVTSPPEQTVKSPSTIIYFCDAFGLNLINNKILADAYADATDMRVLVPACIPGGGLEVWFLNAIEDFQKPVGVFDIMGHLNRIKILFFGMAAFIPFRIKAQPAKAYPTILDWTRQVKAELPAEAKLGAAGFCWGGWISTKLCTETATLEDSESLLNAQFTAHPSFMKGPAMVIDGVKAHNVPYSLAVGDHDHHMSVAQKDEAEAALTRLKEQGQDLHFEFRVYEGMAHGFSLRGDSKDKAILDAMEGTKKQATDWFNKWL